jgi:hypothetical protein
VSAAFTPGPWRLNGTRRDQVACGELGRGYVVAQAVGLAHTSSCEAEANAHLIAAAPDLYAALVRLGTLAAAKYGSKDDELWAACTQGIAACAKARGEA